MHKKLVIVGALGLCVSTLVGCSTPSYVNDAPSSVVESIEMTQSETALKLNKISNNVIATSGTLEQQMTKYLSSVTESGLDDKNAILSSILTNISSTKNSITEIQSFNPASALKERSNEILLQLNNVETYLRGLQKAVEEDNYEDMNSNFNNYMNSISLLKTLSTGMS